MTTKKKLIVAALIAIAISSIAGYGIYVHNRGVVAVQAGSVIRQDLTQTVSANGEIKPKKYVNVSSNMMGRIVRLPVKEGDRVRDGDLLVQLEAVQSEADVSLAEASLDESQSELEGMAASVRSAEAAVTSSKADITKSEADLARAKQAFVRAEQMAKEGLIANEQFERTKADYDIAEAQLNSAKAHLAQAEAQLGQTLKQRDSTSSRIAQMRASLVRARDQFSKTTIRSTLDGIITNLPVNEGEIAIVGLQNQPGTTLMTIADMSIITAEVRVDETDIVNLKLGQEAKIKVDALGDRMLEGRVTEIGNSALLRSTSTSPGTSTGTGTGQEAKDFKVVITLDEPPQELRPGLSCTATILTAMREKILTAPIQALTIRELDTPLSKKKVEKEGVFILSDGVASFRPVKTGITGTTEIEVLDGLAESDQIVTGPYQVLRTLQDNTRIKIQKAP
jgi:HlyD family secretion protein